MSESPELIERIQYELEAAFTDQVTDQVAALILAIGSGELGSNDLMRALGLSHRPIG